MAPQQRGGVILLDVAAGGGRFDRSTLERLGYPVAVCNGPAGRPCPLLGGRGLGPRPDVADLDGFACAVEAVDRFAEP